jgi:hypothetical protein
VSNAVFTVRGRASDNWAVSDVWLQLNGGSWTSAAGTTNWSAGLNLTPGTNSVQAFAVDTSGNRSLTNTLNLDFVVTNQLGLQITGLGTLSPNDSNAWLEVGRNYTITAVPAAGFLFTNWTVSTNWQGGAGVEPDAGRRLRGRDSANGDRDQFDQWPAPEQRLIYGHGKGFRQLAGGRGLL